MSALNSVSGVSGMCWVGFGHPPQVPTVYDGALRAVCGVCWVWLRVRACVTLSRGTTTARIFPHARTQKLDTPNTLHSNLFKWLILKGFNRAGVVSGWGVFVLGLIFQGVGR